MSNERQTPTPQPLHEGQTKKGGVNQPPRTSPPPPPAAQAPRNRPTTQPPTQNRSGSR